MLKLSTLRWLVCLALVQLSSLVYAETDQRCDSYVKSSLRQFNENVVNSCSFGGSRWSNNEKGQKKWCLGVREQALLIETSERNKLLERCKTNLNKQGKKYVVVEESCFPDNLSEIKTNPKVAYNCLIKNKSAVKGKVNGYSYLVYLSSHNKSCKLVSFVSKGNSISSNINQISNERSRNFSCGIKRKGGDVFTLKKKPDGMSITYKYSDSRSYGSWGRSVVFTLIAGVWRPVSAVSTRDDDYYSSQSKHNASPPAHAS